MWLVSYASTATSRPLHRHIPISNPTITPRKSLSNLVVSFSATDSNENDIGGLGRTLLTAIKSVPATPKPRQSDGEDGSHISGSDVLWAMTKVADKKKKKMKKQSRERALSSAVGLRVDSSGSEYESDDDDVAVRPLVVKSEWASKLDNLEKRLIDLSQTK